VRKESPIGSALSFPFCQKNGVAPWQFLKSNGHFPPFSEDQVLDDLTAEADSISFSNDTVCRLREYPAWLASNLPATSEVKRLRDNLAESLFPVSLWHRWQLWCSLSCDQMCMQLILSNQCLAGAETSIKTYFPMLRSPQSSLCKSSSPLLRALSSMAGHNNRLGIVGSRYRHVGRVDVRVVGAKDLTDVHRLRGFDTNPYVVVQVCRLECCTCNRLNFNFLLFGSFSWANVLALTHYHLR
jgi:hypothetical protein